METRGPIGIPWQIRLFESLMLTGVALGAVYAWLGWGAIGDHVASGWGALLHILCLAVTSLLTLLVSRSRSVAAKWLLIVVALLCLAGMMADGAGVLEVVQAILELVALALLFTRPAVLYLEHKPSSV